MTRISLSLLIAGLVGLSAPAFGGVRRPEHWLIIATGVPPARIVVLDAQGRRAGINPARPLVANGMPLSWTLPGEAIQDIPGSDVDWQNIASDDGPDIGKTSNTTGWHVTIKDSGAQVYEVVLTGIVEGVSLVQAKGSRRSPKISGRLTNIRLFTVPDLERRLTVDFNPDREGFVIVRRVVEPGHLPEDVGSACRLGQIEPEGICISLLAKADAAAKAFARGRTKAARGALNAFLNELKAQGDKHVHEPALTILREEAEALLNPSPPMRRPKPKRPVAVE